jgi:hypothetical protein
LAGWSYKPKESFVFQVYAIRSMANGSLTVLCGAPGITPSFEQVSQLTYVASRMAVF